MTIKYRVHEVSKDLNVPAKEIIDLLGKHFDGVKKHMTALTEEELSVVFEHFTQQNQVKDFNAYFASRNTEKKKAEEQAVAESPAPAKKAESKAAEPKAEKTVEHKTESKKAEAKPADKKPEVKASEQKNDRARTEAKQNVTSKSAQEKKEVSPKGAQPQKPVDKKSQAPERAQQANQTRPAAPRSADNQRNDNKKPAKPQPQRQAQAPAKPSLQIDSKTFEEGARLAAQKHHKQPQVQEQPKGEKTVRHVDTRAAHVNLDKYNEKYDNIASQGKVKDNYQKKQKLTQKSHQRAKQQFSTKRETEAEKLRRLELERARKQQLKVSIPDEIVISELAQRLKVTASEVIKRLIPLGIMASINEIIDFDTASLVAEDLGAKVEKEVVVTIEERLFDDTEDEAEDLFERSPVVVVMGHVDHGKTSLLDAIRKEHVTSTEAGGITQHIGAYQVPVGEKNITFLDTPGHEAFTSMRARGASITDIAILVVAADDGIMPQTVEAINHAKAANVSIIVAINKMDKPTANPDKVKQELTEYELVPEEWGGDVPCIPVSAVTGEGIDDLLEMVTLVAEVKELKANPNRMAKGAVIEARLDKGRGPIATVLVQNGTLHVGDVLIAGTSVGRVRAMVNDKGESVQDAGPSTPVEITGLAEVPAAGDIFNAVENERLARELVEQRKHHEKEEIFNSYQKVTLDNLFSQIEEGEMKELPIIVKADVQGSVEAVKQSLEKLSNSEVRVRVIHGAVGAISKSDIMLANASNAIVIGFNVRPDPIARDSAEEDGVELRLYRVIYDAIEDVQQAMKGLLDPKTREVELGHAEVREVYKITNVGIVAGCYVQDGKVARSALIRVVRDGIVIAEDKIASLKRFKDDQKEVAQGYECGIGLEKFSDIKVRDILESFIIEEYRD